MVIDSRTSWLLVCLVTLLGLFTENAARPWQAADLQQDLSYLVRVVSLPSVPIRQPVRMTASRLAMRAENQMASASQPAVTAWDLAEDDDNRRFWLQSYELQQPVVAICDLNLFASADHQIESDALTGADSSPSGLPSIRPVGQEQAWFARTRYFASGIACWFRDRVTDPVSTAVSAATNPGSGGSPGESPGQSPGQSPATGQSNVQTSESVQSESSMDAEDNVTTGSQWVLPKALIRELKKFEDTPAVASWAQSTIDILLELKSLSGVSDPESRSLLERLAEHQQQLDFITVQVSTIPVQDPSMAQGELATSLRQIRYSLQRRLEIWPIVHELSRQQPSDADWVDDGQAGRFLLASATRLNTEGMEQGWVDYLKLNEAASVFNSISAKPYNQRIVAREVLARMHSPSLSIAQRKYLGSAIDPATLEVLKSAATEPVDLSQMLQRIERDELHRNGATAYYLNDTYQNLLWSRNPEYWRLADRLQHLYRDANFRVSVSEELLNRLIPQQPETSEPYRDNFLGAQLRGQNRISNEVRISLIPDPNQISLRLETVGSVNSRTTATKSGVVVENVSHSRFSTMKRLAFGQQGVFEYRPQTSSRIRQRVVGLQTNMDGIPPVGWIVRKIARNKIEQQAPAARRYAQNQLESSVETRFEQEISQQLDELETMLTEKLLHPLVAIDLEPDPLEIQTTADRVNLRYRLAGRDQMAAATARPRAVQSCLMSMQFHESAANNLMSRFDFAGRKFESQELVQYINTVFRSDFVIDDGKSRKSAEFEFAPFDPIRIDFEEDQIVASVNLKSFRIGNGKRWKNLNVRAIYEPRMEEGFRLNLTQSEEGLRIKGKRLNAADQIAIGLICEILFPDQFDLALMPANVAKQLNLRSVQATQFVVSSGWIGLSVDDVARVAERSDSVERPRKILKRGRR